MTSLVSFRCTACDIVLPDMKIPPILPSWASFAAFPVSAWSDDPATVSASDFTWPEAGPLPGEEYFLLVGKPFSFPDPTYTPWIQIPADDWDERPHEIAHVTFARIGLIEVLSVAEATAWLKVRVLETRMVDDFVTAFEPQQAPLESPFSLLLNTGDRRRHSIVVDGDFAYISYSADGDLGEWAVCRKRDGSWRLLLYGVWDFHSDVIYAGHQLLNERDLQAFGLN